MYGSATLSSFSGFDHNLTGNLGACSFLTVMEYCWLFSVSELSSDYTACSYACIKSYEGYDRFSRFFYWDITAKKTKRYNRGKKRQTKWNNTDRKVDVWFLPTGSSIESTAICLHRELTLAVLTAPSQSSGHNTNKSRTSPFVKRPSRSRDL